MNKYILFFLILLTGFTSSDVRKEIISIEWQVSELPENRLGYTFQDAGYLNPGSQVPIYFKNIELNHSDYKVNFILENPEFEQIDSKELKDLISEIPEETELKQTVLKSGNKRWLELQIPAVIRKGENVFLLKRFELKQTPGQPSLKSAQAPAFQWKTESLLKEGKWVKISTSEKGIYKIPYSTLAEYGFSNPSQVKVFGAGGKILPENPGNIIYDDLPQVAVWHGKNNGTDCLFFYSPGVIEWSPVASGNYFEHRLNPYIRNGHFFLSEGGGSAKNIQLQPEITETATHTVSAFPDFLLFKDEKYNLIKSGKQWYSEKFINGTNKNYKFKLSGLVNSSEVNIRVNAAGRSSSSSSMQVSADDSSLGRIDFSAVNKSSGTAVFADARSVRYSHSAADENVNLKLIYSGHETSVEAWLNFIEVNYLRKLSFSSEIVFFRDKKSVGDNNISDFFIETQSADIKVWDVTDIFNVMEIPVRREGNIAKMKRPADSLREYAAFSANGSFPEPVLVGDVENQNLHGLSTPEFLIITHSAFHAQANELADFHRTEDGMKTEVVQVNKIYNEFSSGNKDATGIRNFIKMFYDRDNGLKYVLLMGDGSYDNKGIIKSTASFIPTFQSDNSLEPVSSFVTDDYFVILDEGESVYNGAIDLGIGRIPASTVAEAETVVRKTKDYHTSHALGSWRNVVSFIADDEDNGLHMSDSERLADYLNENHGEFITNKIYLDAYQQITGPGGERYPEVTEAINSRVREGALILNYVGHANERFLADERVLEISHINSWSNKNRLFIFVTATCEFSRFDADDISAGEYALFNPSGGAIGLFSTTRLVFAYSNYLLSKSFYTYVFQKNGDGENYRMGDIMRLAKINTINTINKRSFSLLANPALRLSYPRHRIYTTEINGRDAANYPDTVGALSLVTIKGYVGDADGNKLSGFSGEITPTVYDKAVMMKTRGNGGETPIDFKVQENIIYKGMTEVENGEFSFSFVIPKDISYSLGQGKIVYYAHNGETDAHGTYENFIIGGTGSQIADNIGPEINLYLDSPDFISGDRVSMNPVLLAYLYDESGINTAGSGIGHDITAVLNNDNANAIVLNNYYQSDPGDYTGGTITYPLKNLPPGKHTLKLKAWDVANNSSEAEIEFEVTDDFYISQINAYPNPVSNHTYFTFEHNQADAVFQVILEVFDLHGKRIDFISTDVGSGGNNSNPIKWDLNNAGAKIRGGIYLMRVTARNSDGKIASKSGKIIVAR